YLMPSVMDYIPASGRQGLYFRHETARSMIAGLPTEDVLHDIVDPDGYPTGADTSYIAEVGDLLSSRLPSLADARLGNVWAGLYPISPDGSPGVGPYRDRPGVVAALGRRGAPPPATARTGWRRSAAAAPACRPRPAWGGSPQSGSSTASRRRSPAPRC